MDASVEHLRFPIPSSGLPTVDRPSRNLEAVVDELAMVLPTEATPSSLVLRDASVDHLGMTHVRYDQTWGSLPVFFAGARAHVRSDGTLASLTVFATPTDTPLNTKPTLSESDAMDRARDHARRIVGQAPPETAVDAAALEQEPAPGGPVLGVLPQPKGPPRLVYRIELTTSSPTLASWVVFVDGHDGTIRKTIDNLPSVHVRGQGRGVRGDLKALDVRGSDTGDFFLEDRSREPGSILTRNLLNERDTTKGVSISSTTADNWDGATSLSGAAVDAHHYSCLVYDYFRKTFGRLGPDGKGTALVAYVHFGRKVANAFWHRDGVVFGDGDGQNTAPFSSDFGVVAHEYVHGFTAATSKLVYENQSGALNEALSDIFAAFMKHAFQNNAATDWLNGEVANLDGVPFRSLARPLHSKIPQPDHMKLFVRTSEDNGGVHVNSGIPNHAAYLMTMGGLNESSGLRLPKGIGFSKAEKLWYRVATDYLVETSTFVQAAQATLDAADDLKFTVEEKNIVECAWIATGVLGGKCKGLSAATSSTVARGPEASEGNGGGTPGRGKTTALRGSDEVGSANSSCALAPRPLEASKERGTALAAAVSMALLGRRHRRRGPRSGT
jgi:Zn-dependent metalloprotease